jgi:hypothetical protein
MRFKDCTEYFPIFDTLVGSYQPFASISATEEWRENPFWEDSSCYSFVTFDPDTKKFTAWSYSFWRVNGYINETDDPEEFYPAVCSEDYGWEKVDPWNYQSNDQVIALDDELAIEMDWPLDEIKERKWRREQVAYLFDTDSYLNGFTFTNIEALKKFIKERKDLL